MDRASRWAFATGLLACLLVASTAPGCSLPDSRSGGGDVAGSATETPSEAPASGSERIDSSLGSFVPFEQEDRGDAEARAIPAGTNHVLLEFEYRGPADPPLPNRHPPANTYKDVPPAAYDMTWKYGGYGGAPGPPMGFDVFTADDEGNTGQKVVSRRGPGKDTEPYAGTLLVAAGEARRVIVISDGAWSMRMAPVSTARTMAATTKGVGDDVVLYLGEAAEWRVSGDADLRLRVFDLSGAEVQDLSVPVASVGPGPSIVQVVADGAWEIGVQDGR